MRRSLSSVVHRDIHHAWMVRKDREINDLQAEIAKLQAEREELRELLWWVEAKLQPELNVSNYHHQQVCELNANATEAVLAIRAALAEKGE